MEINSIHEHAFAFSAFCPGVNRFDPVGERVEKSLQVFVIFTGQMGTSAALRKADALAQQLGAHLQLLMAYEVPYVLPLTKPPIAVQFLEGQMQNLAEVGCPEAAGHIYLCRDRRRTLRHVLEPRSLIVIGGRKRSWQTSAQRLAHDLKADGHEVIFAELR